MAKQIPKEERYFACLQLHNFVKKKFKLVGFEVLSELEFEIVIRYSFTNFSYILNDGPND